MSRCSVCDCKISGKRKWNSPNAKTCDPICTRAKKNAIGREEEISWEMQQEEAHELEQLRVGYTFTLIYK